MAFITCGLSDRLRIFPARLDSGQTEIADFYSEVVIMKENVVALEITMNDVFGM